MRTSDLPVILGGCPTIRLDIPPRNVLDAAMVDALHRAVDIAASDWSWLSSLSGGGPISQLEEAFASAVGTRHALAVSSGTTALFTTLKACGVGHGDEVIVPTYTWGQSAAPILHAGAMPVYADVEPGSWTLSPAEVERLSTTRTRAVIVVHLFGHPANMPALVAACQRHNLSLIEDASQGFGAHISGRPVGSWGRAACFSLGRGKPVTAGEGGVITTNDRGLYEDMVSLSQHPLRLRYELSERRVRQVGEFGYNFRMHPLAAAVAVADMQNAEFRKGSRNTFWNNIAEALEGIPGIRPARPETGCLHAWYLNSPSFVPSEMSGGALTREMYLRALVAEGVPIGTDPIRVPLHLRPQPDQTTRRWMRKDCPVAEERCAHTGMVFASGLIDAGPIVIEQVAAAIRKIAVAAPDIVRYAGSAKMSYEATQKMIS